MIGAATSGQAARTLGSGAGIESRTVASLSWRLDHGQIRLTDRHVLILDEAGMTTDADIGRLLTAVDRAGARAVVVGDYHQLDAVGPGGALEAIAARHPEAVHTLADNLRQIDPAERAALDELRAGSVDAAVGWYGRHGRVHPAATRAGAVYGMVNAWAADVAAGRDSLLLAYRRDNVAALNHAARQAWRALGRLDGLELHAGDGRVFQAGDRIITLTPGPNGQWTTSQRATVTAVDVDHRTLTAITPDGHELHVSGDYLAADRIGYGYAITVHRSQGATVDTAHVLADGGGRELAYVAMSRARGESHVNTIGISPQQAADRLAWEWQHSRRQTWSPQIVDPSELAELRRQRYQLRDSIPPDVRHQLERARSEHDRYRRDLDDLYAARGRWAHHPAGQAAAAYHRTRTAHQQAQEHANDPGLGWWARRKAGQELAAAADALEHADARWQRDGGPLAANYQTRLDHLDAEIARLEAGQQQRREFLERHPDLPDRIAELETAIRELETRVHEQRQHQLDRDPDLVDSLWPGRHHGVSQEPDLGMGL